MRLTLAASLVILAFAAATPLDKRSVCNVFWDSKAEDLDKRELSFRDTQCGPEKRSYCTGLWQGKAEDLDARELHFRNTECPPLEKRIPVCDADIVWNSNPDDLDKREECDLEKRSVCNAFWDAKAENLDERELAFRDTQCGPVKRAAEKRSN